MKDPRKQYVDIHRLHDTRNGSVARADDKGGQVPCYKRRCLSCQVNDREIGC